MGKSKTEVKNKIRKLLAKAESTAFEAEAALLAEKARELLDKYNLSQAEIKPEERETEEMKQAQFGARTRHEGWMVSLFAGISRAFDTFPITSKIWNSDTGKMETVFRAIGYEEDTELVVYTYEFLFRCVEEAFHKDLPKAKAQAAENGERWNRRRSFAYRNAFCSGFVHSVLNKIDKERETRLRANVDMKALVVLRKDAVEGYVEGKYKFKSKKRKGKGRRRSSSSGFDFNGYKRGRKQGKEQTIRKGIKS